MPGKYSHSVVLADYSSRGIINLPNDQHVAYLKSSPYPSSQYSRASSRAASEKLPAQQPRSRSALDFATNLGSNTGTLTSLGRRVITDTRRESDTNDRVSTKLQRPSSSDGARSRGTHLLTQPKHPSHFRTAPPVTGIGIINLPKPTPSEMQHPALRAKSSQDGTIRASDFLREPPRASSQARNHARVEAQSNATSTSIPKTPAKLGPAINMTSNKDVGQPIVKQAPSNRPAAHNPVHPSRTPLQRSFSQDTQIYAPQVPLEEPDFEGFSDAGEPETSYFEKRDRSNSASAPRSVSQTNHRSDRFDTPSPGRTARASESKAKTYRSLSTEPSDSDVFAVIGASPTYSHSKLDSLTSVSTSSSRGIISTARTVKHGETKKMAAEHPTQEWRLPEIHEDIAFDPDFFTQGPEDFIQPTTSNESEDSFLNRPLGTISAGRDVDFSKENDSDAESEVDAACPPDIGRFRNGDESGSASFLQVTKNDNMVGNGIGSSASTPKGGKKSGFFARLRSASRQRS